MRYVGRILFVTAHAFQFDVLVLGLVIHRKKLDNRTFVQLDITCAGGTITRNITQTRTIPPKICSDSALQLLSRDEMSLKLVEVGVNKRDLGHDAPIPKGSLQSYFNHNHLHFLERT